jgi:hypothetical protein
MPHCLPGLFNALNGLGAGGRVESQTSSTANAVLYATFAVSAFFAGYLSTVFFLFLETHNANPCSRSLNNKIGSRLTLLLGTSGYVLYIGSYLYEVRDFSKEDN